ncbi:MAG: SIS domain-containing protein [Rudaea sp.]
MIIQRIFAEHAAVMDEAAATLPSSLEDVSMALQSCLENKHKVLACGNGGSAASAQHLVAELVCRFRNDRRALAAVALCADTMTLTAIGNDYGYDRIFARQVEAIASAGDVLVAISTSGNSANIIQAAKAMRTLGCKVIALTGGDGGELAAHAHVVVRAPSRVVARIQEVHDVCIHVIAQALEENVRLASTS